MQPATGESFPLGELNKLLSIYIEELNSKAPSFSSFIAFSIRPMPTAKRSEERYQQTSKKCTSVLQGNLDFLHLTVCIKMESIIKLVL